MAVAADASNAADASVAEQFELCVSFIGSAPPEALPTSARSQASALKLYGWFKQANAGPCTKPKPSVFDPVGRQKWQAWAGLADMPKTKAQAAYVNFVRSVSGPNRQETTRALV
eukprot:m.180881 g.180881  ORF g.180881 m.180881 type:complete len:114 (-) comp18024_c0_seq3:52-393(-)